MQSDTWASSRSGWATPAGPERIHSKTVFWAAGRFFGLRRGDSYMRIDVNRFDPISMWIGCWLDGSGSASSILRRWGHVSRGRDRGAIYAVMSGSTYAISEIIGTSLSRGDSPSETLVPTPPLSIPATPLIVRSMRCRLVRNVFQRNSEIKLRVEHWSKSARTGTRRPSVIWRSTHAVELRGPLAEPSAA